MRCFAEDIEDYTTLLNNLYAPLYPLLIEGKVSPFLPVGRQVKKGDFERPLTGRGDQDDHR